MRAPRQMTHGPRHPRAAHPHAARPFRTRLAQPQRRGRRGLASPRWHRSGRSGPRAVERPRTSSTASRRCRSYGARHPQTSRLRDGEAEAPVIGSVADEEHRPWPSALARDNALAHDLRPEAQPVRRIDGERAEHEREGGPCRPSRATSARWRRRRRHARRPATGRPRGDGPRAGAPRSSRNAMRRSKCRASTRAARVEVSSRISNTAVFLPNREATALAPARREPAVRDQLSGECLPRAAEARRDSVR